MCGARVYKVFRMYYSTYTNYTHIIWTAVWRLLYPYEYIIYTYKYICILPALYACWNDKQIVCAPRRIRQQLNAHSPAPTCPEHTIRRAHANTLVVPAASAAANGSGNMRRACVSHIHTHKPTLCAHVLD